MPLRDTRDFGAAFTIGAILGIGTMLLLRPRPSSRVERLLKQVEPQRRKAARTVKQARKRVRSRVDASPVGRGEVVSAGRDLVHDFRDELTELVSSAREELSRTVEDQLAQAQKALRRRARQISRRA